MQDLDALLDTARHNTGDAAALLDGTLRLDLDGPDRGRRLIAAARLDDVISLLRAAQQAAVTASRAEGATWAEVGTAFEVTRQAAHERWS